MVSSRQFCTRDIGKSFGTTDRTYSRDLPSTDFFDNKHHVVVSTYCSTSCVLAH